MIYIKIICQKLSCFLFFFIINSNSLQKSINMVYLSCLLSLGNPKLLNRPLSIFFIFVLAFQENYVNFSQVEVVLSRMIISWITNSDKFSAILFHFRYRTFICSLPDTLPISPLHFFYFFIFESRL